MGRIFAFIAAAVIFIMLFTACGQNEEASSNVKLELNISEAVSDETTVKADEAEETTAGSVVDAADVTTAVSASSGKVTVTVTSSAEKKDEVKKTTSASPSETVTKKPATNTTAADEKNLTAQTSSKAENTPIRTTMTNKTEAVKTFIVTQTAVQTVVQTAIVMTASPPKPVITTTAPQKKEIHFELDLLNTDISKITPVLGEPVRIGGGLACTQSGNDISVYYYDGLEIQCEVRDDGEFIYDIVITGGGYKTSKNVGTGSRRGDVERAYGKGEINGYSVCYIDGEREMNIIYDGDKVAEIEFYMPV